VQLVVLANLRCNPRHPETVFCAIGPPLSANVYESCSEGLRVSVDDPIGGRQPISDRMSLQDSSERTPFGA
jgi:hypothetical protein